MKHLALALCALWPLSCAPREEPFAKVGGGSSVHPSGWGCVSVHVFSSSRRKVQYAIAAACHEFEPMCPPLSYTHGYSMDRGGTLILNGRPMVPPPEPRVLALNPFGQMEEFAITGAEASILLEAADPEPVWEKVVLPHLAIVDGRTVDGKRLGHWTVSGKSGVKGYEGDYVEGKRDGLWKYYTADGKLRATLRYKLGKLDGDATEIDATGNVIRRVRWKDNFPLDGPQSWSSLSHTVTRTPGGVESGSGH